MRAPLVVGASIVFAATALAQMQSLSTDDLNVVYFGTERYLAPHAARCFENALAFHRKMFDYTPAEKITVLLHDFGDTGNAGASAVPNDRVLVTIAPFSYALETVLGNERINWVANHELVHIVASDQAAARDRRFRSLFAGKVAPISSDPLSLLYAYLTTPRLFAPRWYHEGAAVFMETWMTGGLGRAMGAYDETVFRTMVAEGSPIYDPVGLESAASRLDFQVGVNAYLYGTRFVSFLALTWGPEKVIDWVARREGSKASYSAQFQKVFGLPLAHAWSRWTEWERSFQKGNLDHLHEAPFTPYTPLGRRPLGSVSRAIVDRARHTAYLAVNYPGQVAHLASLDLLTGKLAKICDVKGPALYTVASIAFDPSALTLFYTTDNNDWRDLRGVDLRSGRSRTYLKDARVGDLAFNQADRSLWGVRHYNGISTLVRIPRPYTEWTQVYSWPYGTDIYDLDVSPDGKRLVAALTRIDGSESLIVLDTAKLLAGDASYDVLSDFESSSPANFVFSPDGASLYGSSYYSGVSNIYRVDLATKTVEPLTNADTGYFRPVPLTADAVLAFRYTSGGFLPVLIAPEPVAKVNSITFLGQQIVEKHPIVTHWKIPPPSTVDLDPMIRSQGDYSPFATLKARSLYPIVEGYKDLAAIGAHLSLTDSIGYNRLALSASYSPGGSIPDRERLHLKASYSYLGWKAFATLNNADFYDLFGPTKRSRKGYSLGLEYKRYLIFDEPNRYLDWQANLTGYGDLEVLPGAQNIASTASELVTADLSIGYKYERSSLGAIAPEKGLTWRATLSDSYARATHFPSLRLDLDLGVPLPISHSSLWLRTSAGTASGDRAEPFANFYFGGFGNNWVDDKPYRRYHESGSFPGVDIDEISGRSYAKAMLELNLPPLVFTHVGSPSFFLNWASLALFGTGLVTSPENASLRREAVDAGVQLDLRLVALSHHQLTLSFGYATAKEKGKNRNDELMVSLRIPLYE